MTWDYGAIDRCDSNNPVLIPEVTYGDRGDHAEWVKAGAPAWARCVDRDQKPLKPHIRCKCGEWSGIGLHHVHADGRVTASFFHATKEQLAAMGEAGKRFSPGCGWHVFLKLAGYDQGEFLPEK